MKSHVQYVHKWAHRKYTAFLKYTHEIKPFHVELKKINSLVWPALDFRDELSLLTPTPVNVQTKIRHLVIINIKCKHGFNS